MLLPPDPQQGWLGGGGGVGWRQQAGGGLGVQPHPPARAAIGALEASNSKPAATIQRPSKRLFIVGRLHGRSDSAAPPDGTRSLARFFPEEGKRQAGMSHSNTQRLTDYWRRRRGAGLAPLRSSVDPCDFADLLPQIFILGRTAPGRFAFRLGGGLLEDLHGRDLRRSDFIPLWAGADRPGLQSAMENSLRRGQAIIVETEGVTDDGRNARLEILLAPMISNTGQVDRFLGLYQPVSPLQRLYGRPLERLSVHQVLTLAPSPVGAQVHVFPQLRLAAVDGRRIA